MWPPAPYFLQSIPQAPVNMACALEDFRWRKNIHLKRNDLAGIAHLADQISHILLSQGLNCDFLALRRECFSILREWNRVIQDCNSLFLLKISDPKHLEARAEAFFQSRRLREALDDYQMLLKLMPENPFFRHKCREIYSMLDDWSSLVADYESCRAKSAESAEFILKAIESYFRLKRWQGVIDASEQLIRKKDIRFNHHAHLYSAKAFRCMEDWPHVVQRCSLLLALIPKHPEGLHLLFEALFVSKQLPAFIHEFNQRRVFALQHGEILEMLYEIYKGTSDWDGALEACKHLFFIKGRALKPLLMRADAYFGLKQWNFALADYSGALSFDPTHTYAKLRYSETKGLIEEEKSKNANSLDVHQPFKTLEMIDQEHCIRFALEAAEKLCAQKQWRMALLHIQAIQEFIPGHFQSACLRLIIYNETNQHNLFINEFEALFTNDRFAEISQETGEIQVSAITLSSQVHYKANLLLLMRVACRIYQQQKKWEPLVAKASRILTIFPNDKPIREIRLEAAFRMKNWDMCLEDLKALMDPENPIQELLEIRLNVWINKEEWDQAIIDCSTLLSKKPEDPQLLKTRVRAYAKKQNWSAVAHDCCKLNQLFPAEPFWLNLCTFAYRNLNQWENLAQGATRWLKIPAESDNPEPLSRRILAYLKLEKWEEASSDCSLLLKKHPGNTQTIKRRLIANQNLYRWNEVIEDASKLLARDPSDFEALKVRIKAYKHLKKFDRLKIDIEKLGRAEEHSDDSRRVAVI